MDQKSTSVREFGGKYSSKINSIQKHLVRNDRGAIQKQHQTKKSATKKENVLAQHDRGAIQKQRKTKANWYDKMKSFGTRRSKRNLKNTKKQICWFKVKQKSTSNLEKQKKLILNKTILFFPLGKIDIVPLSDQIVPL